MGSTTGTHTCASLRCPFKRTQRLHRNAVRKWQTKVLILRHRTSSTQSNPLRLGPIGHLKAIRLCLRRKRIQTSTGSNKDGNYKHRIYIQVDSIEKFELLAFEPNEWEQFASR